MPKDLAGCCDGEVRGSRSERHAGVNETTWECGVGPECERQKRGLQQHAGWDESMQSQQLVPVDKVFQKHVSRESPHMVPLLHLSNVGRRVGGRGEMLAVNSQDRGDEAFFKSRSVNGRSCATQDKEESMSTTDFCQPLFSLLPSSGGPVLLTTSHKSLGKEVRL